MICTADQSVQTDNGKPTAVVVWAEGKANDNSGKVSRLVCDRQSGTNFTIGKTTVTCEAFDGSGNSAECTFQVIVTGSLLVLCTVYVVLQAHVCVSVEGELNPLNIDSNFIIIFA